MPLIGGSLCLYHSIGRTGKVRFMGLRTSPVEYVEIAPHDRSHTDDVVVELVHF